MRREFVSGGSASLAHLVPYEKDGKMRNTLSDKQRQQIYNAYCLGEKPDDLVQQFGFARSTIYKAISDQRNLQEKGGEMASKTKTIAGDRTNGRLTTTADPTKFEGTCVVRGKCKSKTFSAAGSRHAVSQWEKWCKDLRDEQDFMDMVERKPACDSDEEPADVTLDSRAKSKPEPFEEIRTIQVVEPPAETVPVPSDEKIREAIHEAQREFDAITTRHTEATGVPLADTSEPAYLIWAKRPEPRCYGLYLTMDDALRELDKLNEVARFLGSGGAFEVEEVEWKVGK